MTRTSRLILIFVPFFLGPGAGAQISEKERLSGFAEHQKNQERFDEARLKGERAYFEEEEQWENQKNRTLEGYKKTKKQAVVHDDGPEAKADAAAKIEYAKKYEEDRRAYAKKRSRQDVVVHEDLNLPTEAQELGLNEERPRYDYRKRAMFGGQPKYGKVTGGSSSSAGGGSGRGSISPGGTSFPPPPTFDDFGGADGGYVPAPSMPDDFGDIPPPPPPPMPMGDDFGGEGMDFPPPPPPPFNDDGGF